MQPEHGRVNVYMRDLDKALQASKYVQHFERLKKPRRTRVSPLVFSSNDHHWHRPSRLFQPLWSLSESRKETLGNCDMLLQVVVVVVMRWCALRGPHTVLWQFFEECNTLSRERFHLSDSASRADFVSREEIGGWIGSRRANDSWECGFVSYLRFKKRSRQNIERVTISLSQSVQMPESTGTESTSNSCTSQAIQGKESRKEKEKQKIFEPPSRLCALKRKRASNRLVKSHLRYWSNSSRKKKKKKKKKRKKKKNKKKRRIGKEKEPLEITWIWVSC